MFRTSNPALSNKTFVGHGEHTDSMTINGTVNKAALLILLTIASAAYTWNVSASSLEAAYATGKDFTLSSLFMIGGIGGFILAIITVFKKTWAPVTGPLYAVLKGMFLGGISLLFEIQFPGIVFQALFATMGTFVALLMAYKSGLIKATENFKLGVVAATGGIMILYIITLVMNLFGAQMPFVHDTGAIGIGFSLFVVVVAALNLVLDFDFIESGEETKAPKYLEWYGAFSLLITLVWLYVEFLRLIAKLRSE